MQASKWILLLSGLLLVLGQGCGKTDPAAASFYHWRTRLELSPAEQAALQRHAVQRLYVKYFDVDRADARLLFQPLARLQAASPQLPNDLEVVPCVFITNRSFRDVHPEDCEQLAVQVHTELLSLHQQLPDRPLREVQMDCDWTPSTQKPYFLFLQHLHTLLTPDSIQLSATIRLHQYKFAEETGVPPVDRGMLMVYNLGNLDAPDETNSIFTTEQMEAYILPERDYPLALDVALPIFGWAVLLRRGRPIRLLNNVRMDTLANDPRFEKAGPQRAEVRESHYFYGHYLYQGDILRTEAVSPQTLLNAARFLHQSLPPTDKRNVALYHLDPRTLKYYDEDTLQAVFDAFDR